MKEKLKVFGALFGSAVVFPSAVFWAAVSAIGSRFEKSDGLTLVSVIVGVAAVLVAMVPVLTGINFVKPQNELAKSSSILVLLAGGIVLLGIVLLITDEGFNLILTGNLISSGLIVLSGYWQFRDS